MTPPWRGEGRGAYVADAARRVFVTGDLPNWRAASELFVDPCPESIYVADDDAGARAGVELHAVGVHEGRGDGRKEETRQPQLVHVSIRKASRPIVLLLMSYDPVLWEIALDEGALLKGVVLSSYYQSEVRCPAALCFVTPIANGPHAHTLRSSEPGEPHGAAVIASLERAGKMPIASFQGCYRADSFVVPCWQDEAVVREVVATMRGLARERTRRAPAPFLLVDAGFIMRRGTREEPTPAPHGVRAVTLCEADGRCYAITDHALLAIDAGGESETIIPPEDGLSWLGGITYDSKRRRIILTTHWHTGAHHFYDPLEKRWERLEFQSPRGSIHAVAYEPTRDVVLALVGGLLGPPTILVLSPDLRTLHRVLETEPLPVSHLMGGETAVQMVAFADTLVLCTAEGRLMTFGEARVTNGFVLGLDGGELWSLDLDPAPQAATAEPIQAVNGTELVGDAPAAPREAYEGWIYSSDLKLDGPRILEQVRKSGSPLTVMHRSAACAVLVNYETHNGQVLSLDEMRFPDWQDRLARARRELADKAFVPDSEVPRGWPPRGAGPPRITRWTRQAKEDFAGMASRDQRIVVALGLPPVAWSVPLDGPYRGLRAAPKAKARIVFEMVGEEARIAYVRTMTHAGTHVT